MYLYTENNPCQLYLSDFSDYEDLVSRNEMIIRPSNNLNTLEDSDCDRDGQTKLVPAKKLGFEYRDK